MFMMISNNVSITLVFLGMSTAVRALSSVTPPKVSKPVVTSTGTAIPWKQAVLDYSATNGFLDHYYGIKNYFKNDHKPETVYNARSGVLMKNGNPQNGEDETLVPASLGNCGFELVHAPGSEVSNWQDLEQVRNTYLPRARHAILQAYASSSMPPVKDIIFWKPTERSGPTSYVSPVHIDIDVNAYGNAFDDLLDFVYSCHVPDDPVSDAAQREMWKEALEGGARFCVTNVWHNVREDLPAIQAPMGLLRTHYDTKDSCQVDSSGLCPSDDEEDENITSKDILASWPALPHVKPSNKSRWYTFPAVTSDELLLFTQYDRDVRTTTDVWHCALTNVINHSEQYSDRSDDDARNRHSFDMRCLVLLDESVPEEWDRCNPKHHIPMRSEALAEES